MRAYLNGQKSRKKAPAEPVVPDTQEDLVAQLAASLDQADRLLLDRHLHVRLDQWDNTIGRQKATINELMGRLDKLGLGSLDIYHQTFAAAPGTVPSWTRPGTWIIWLGYVPCRAIWGGLADPHADVVAVDPNAPWFAPSGSVSTGTGIALDLKNPDDLIRTYLVGLTRKLDYVGVGRNKPGKPDFSLKPLADLGRTSAQETLIAPGNQWIAAALKRGPVNEIKLPPHLRAVEVSMFV
jgi:hypothetical protein